MRNRTSGPILAAYVICCVACGWAAGATGWAQPEYTVTITTPFSGMSQTRSGSTVVTLNHDAAVTIQASVAAAGDEVLRSPGGDTLTTSYKLTGAALGGSADTNWVPSSTFISAQRSYGVEGTGPSEITIRARSISASDRANEAATYTAFIILTVTW